MKTDLKTDLENASIDGARTEFDTDLHSSAHTSARMSASRRRIEVITGADRRRRWSIEQKQAIVSESLAPHASPTAVARKYGLNTGQLYTWRRQMLSRVAVMAPGGFARVDVVEDPARLAASAMASPATPSGLIEVVLPGGASVRVDARVNERALRRVLAALRE